MEFETQAADVDPVPEHGPSRAVNVGHVSTVPLNVEQFAGSLHPVVPVQTQVLFHVLQAASAVAVVLALQALAVHAVVVVADETLVQAPSEPVKV